MTNATQQHYAQKAIIFCGWANTIFQVALVGKILRCDVGGTASIGGGNYSMKKVQRGGRNQSRGRCPSQFLLQLVERCSHGGTGFIFPCVYVNSDEGSRTHAFKKGE